MGLTHPRQFKLTPELVELVANLVIDWDESYAGAPCVDIRRPYTTGPGPGGVLAAAGKAARTELVLDEDTDRVTREVVEPDQRRAMELHKQTATALQIVLATRSFRPGTYRRLDQRGFRWERM